MITVEEAENIIKEQARSFGAEIVPFNQSPGRILAEEIKADRDLPPFNRVTMDGIAVSFKAITEGVRVFRIKHTQAAGDDPVEVTAKDECIEIMTGAVLPASTDTVIRYEDLEISGNLAELITDNIIEGQNIHFRGKDKSKGDLLAKPGTLITPSLINLITSVGEAELRVQRMPRVLILSSGNELTEIYEIPSQFQLRRSNSYTLQSVLKHYHLDADVSHLPDDPEIIKNKLADHLRNYDAIIMSGGVSMGKFDYIPAALESLKVDKLFHKVAQRPGKPFWFGKHERGTLIFAFPGNPVASFMCMHRYFLPWLELSLGQEGKPAVFAVLTQSLSFQHPLKYFLQVKLGYNEQYQLIAIPVEGNGSGDFANLADTDAFMELPVEKNEFLAGEAYRVWSF